CLVHLQEDAVALGSCCPTRLRRCLQRVVSFAYVHRRLACRRCTPAEILSAYLTPGEELGAREPESMASLSWVGRDEDIQRKRLPAMTGYWKSKLICMKLG